MSPLQSFVARLVGSILLSVQTRHLEFEMIGVARFEFVPGQWLSFSGRTPAGDDRRAYVCGLKDIVASSRALLQQLGVDRKSIPFEKYD
jgi:hypothetical protein